MKHYSKSFDHNLFVLSHNDLNAYNVIAIDSAGNDLHTSPHPVSSMIFLDFEYAGVSPLGFDIANHFLEWMGLYQDESLLSDGDRIEEGLDMYVRSLHVQTLWDCVLLKEYFLEVIPLLAFTSSGIDSLLTHI